MDELCTSTRRYQCVWELGRDGDDGPFEYTEVELTVPVEDFLVNRWDWNDLRAFLTGGLTPKILWITEEVFLVVDDDDNAFNFAHGYRKSLDAEIQQAGGQKQTLTFASLHPGLTPIPTFLTASSGVR